MSARQVQGPPAKVDTWSDHPLFPVDDGEEQPEVTFVTVTRKEGAKMVWGPTFKAEDLTSVEQIIERFGGGDYELWARAPGKRDPTTPGNCTKRRWLPLPGKSRPFSDDPTQQELRQAGDVPNAISAPSSSATMPAAAPATASGGIGGDGLLVAILNMQAQASQQFMALMLEMMKSSKTEAVESAKTQSAAMQQMTTMLMTLSAQQQQSMMGMMTAMLSAKGGSTDDVAKMAELFKNLGVINPAAGEKAKPSDGFDIGKVLEDGADLVQGLVLLKGGNPAAPNGSSPPAQPSASTTAASLVDELPKT